VGTATFTDTITATSTADHSKTQTFIVTVAPPIEIVDSTSARYALPQSRQTFQAKIAGVVVTSGVNWTASSGTISAAGVWTGDASTLGTVNITGTLASDSTKSASTQINVQANLNVRFRFSTAGDIVFALRPDKAPRHCANLVSLVNERFYEGIKLHRREENFVVQWGCPLTKTLPLTDPNIGTGGPGYTINFEANDLKHVKYSLGMARSSSLDSAGSQIYVCLDILNSLDGNYVVFGDVIQGQSAVDAIAVGDTITSATVELVPVP
jgi:peptidylprolyl isomerase